MKRTTELSAADDVNVAIFGLWEHTETFCAAKMKKKLPINKVNTFF